MVKKCDIIESQPQLVGMLGKPAESVQCSDEVRHCIGTWSQIVRTNGSACYLGLSNLNQVILGENHIFPHIFKSQRFVSS